MKKLILLFIGILFSSMCMAQMTDKEKYNQACDFYNAKEYEKAYPLYIELAERGDARSQCAIGHYYYYGYSPIETNYALAFEWYKKASDQGNAAATNNIGSMYENGEYVIQDYEKAYYFYQKGAELGEAYSSRNIGRMIQDRLILSDVNCYLATAERWFKHSAQIDSAFGNYALARFYGYIASECYSSNINDKFFCGRGYLSDKERDVIRDSLYSVADSLIFLAATNGCIEAQSSLGDRAFHDEKYQDALYWYNIAKKSGAKYVMIDVDTYPIDLAFVLINYLQENPNIHYAITSMGGSAAPKDEDWVISTEKGYFEFLMREGDDWHMGFIRLTLDGKLLLKHPAVHNGGYYDEILNSFEFNEDEGSVSAGVGGK